MLRTERICTLFIWREGTNVGRVFVLGLRPLPLAPRGLVPRRLGPRATRCSLWVLRSLRSKPLRRSATLASSLLYPPPARLDALVLRILVRAGATIGLDGSLASAMAILRSPPAQAASGPSIPVKDRRQGSRQAAPKASPPVTPPARLPIMLHYRGLDRAGPLLGPAGGR